MEGEMSSKVSFQVREEHRFESRRLGLGEEGEPRDGTAMATPWKRVLDGLWNSHDRLSQAALPFT